MKIPQILTLILIFHNILFLYKKKAPNITTRSFHQLFLLLGWKTGLEPATFRTTI